MKELIARALHDETTRAFHVTNGLLSFFILISIAAIPLHFLPSADWASPAIELFDKVAVTVFAIEYVLRIWTAEHPRGYIFSLLGIIDLIAILPFFLHRAGALESYHLYLGLRAIRFFKFGRMHNLEQLAIEGTSRGAYYGLFRPVGDETVQRVIQQHPVTFLIGMIMPLVFTSLGLVLVVFLQGDIYAWLISLLPFTLGAVLFYKIWQDFAYDVMIITNRRVIIQDAELFGVRSNDINYQAITNVMPSNHGIYNWMFQMGKIQIETPAHQGTLDFTHAPRPHEVVRLISENRQKTHRAGENGPGQ